MDPSAMEPISTRLSSINDLFFPLSATSSSPSARKTLMLDLLDCEALVFLERYWALLTPSELIPFETLAHNYEVRFHLSRLKSLHNPDIKSRAFTIKNRCRAYLERLIEKGDYFSEEAMRERELYLHHEMVGKFQDPIERAMSQPGERWSET